MNKKSIVIIILLICLIGFFVLLYNLVQKGIQLANLNNLYKDIEILEDRISMYYLNNRNLPIKRERVEFNCSINPNDSEEFYEIDLDKLENLSLNYGNNKDNDDIYIINYQSHTIYYFKGIVYNNKVYYTKLLDYEEINLEEYQ